MNEENEQIAQRREKLHQLRKHKNAFPNHFRKDALTLDLHRLYGESAEQLTNSTVTVKVAGRMMTRRIMGKASFAHLQDSSGQIQLFLQRDNLDEGVYNDEFKKWDIGDIIGAQGELFFTKTGELSIRVHQVELLTKALRPLPEKFHGLTDPELRYRQRYVDLIMNKESRDILYARAKTVQEIRQFMMEYDFLEVETPMMHPIPGGAVAKPFVTHHNALDMELYLRIAPELYLKKLTVGGVERVFEINRCFRNEGLSTRHNPEFTTLEFYWAYADYEDLIVFTENMIRRVAQRVCKTSQVHYQEYDINFSTSFERLTLLESITHYNPEIQASDLHERACLENICKQHNIPIQSSYGIGKIQTEIFEALVEKKLIQPTFITQYPVEVSPLSRRNDDNPEVTDRFELFVAGREIANGFSELNDAEDQAARFKEQVVEKEAGDEEAMHYDADYIRALEYGMPPTAGEGIGIDRLVMLLTNSDSIRDVILFPHMRHEMDYE